MALFHKGGSLYDYLEKRKKIIVKNIEDYHPIYLKDMNVESEYERVLDKYIIEIPKLLVENISQESKEVEIRDSKNILYRTDNRPVYRRGLHLEIVIPFSGESVLFNYRPSTQKEPVPRGKIENDSVILEYDIIDGDRERFSYSKDLESLQGYLSFVELDVNRFNTWLENNVSNLLLNRKSQSEERNKFVNGLNIPARVREQQYYHMRIKYSSGGKISYFYEVNKPKEIVEFVIYQIETLVPAIRFDGHRIYPKRMNEYKIFVSEFPFEKSSEDLHIQYLDGYDGDFGGKDVTLRGRSFSDSVRNTSGVVRTNIEKIVKAIDPIPTAPETQSNIDEVNAQVKNIGDMVVRIEEQTAPQTLRERIEDNLLDYIITLILGVVVAGIVFFGGSLVL